MSLVLMLGSVGISLVGNELRWRTSGAIDAPGPSEPAPKKQAASSAEVLWGLYKSRIFLWAEDIKGQ